MDRARLKRLLRVYRAGAHSDHSNIKPHHLNQLQLAQLCATHVPVNPSYGMKDGQCTCGNANCKHPGGHQCTIQNATTDEALINKLWTQWPRAKVIIPTGEHNVIAVTIRGRKGQLAYDSLVGKEEDSENNESSSETIEFRGRRTHTYLWHVPDNAIPIGRVKLAEGVVVHGVGSFIVVPRNMTSPGRAKQLYDIEIGSAPSWLLRMLGWERVAERTYPEKLPIVEPTSPEMPPSPEPKPAERPVLAERTFDETLRFELFPVPLDLITIPDGTATTIRCALSRNRTALRMCDGRLLCG